jgi:hypothetical protein
MASTGPLQVARGRCTSLQRRSFSKKPRHFVSGNARRVSTLKRHGPDHLISRAGRGDLSDRVCVRLCHPRGGFAAPSPTLRQKLVRFVERLFTRLTLTNRSSVKSREVAAISSLPGACLVSSRFLSWPYFCELPLKTRCRDSQKPVLRRNSLWC